MRRVLVHVVDHAARPLTFIAFRSLSPLSGRRSRLSTGAVLIHTTTVQGGANLCDEPLLLTCWFGCFKADANAADINITIE